VTDWVPSEWANATDDERRELAIANCRRPALLARLGRAIERRADRLTATRHALAQRTDRGSSLARPRVEGDRTIYAGRAGRTGPHEYPWGTEHRDAAELARIVEQLSGGAIPVRLAHAGPTVGRVRRSWLDGDHAAVEIELDAAGRQAIDAGVKELSLGYRVVIDSANFQRETDVHELAIVDAARCGASCSIRSDAAACCGACGARPGQCSSASDSPVPDRWDRHAAFVARQIRRGTSPLPSNRERKESPDE
jgi:hypothetical protein